MWREPQLLLPNFYHKSTQTWCDSDTYHSMASSSPSPLIADVLKIWYLRFLMAARPRALATSVTVMAPSISCLLANTQRTDFFSSSSYNIHNGKTFKGKTRQLGCAANPRPVATGRVSCICDWLRDATDLDSGDRSWICNAILVTLRHPGLTCICNFWHSGTLALSPERQSAQMSEIRNGRLDLDGTEHFEM